MAKKNQSKSDKIKQGVKSAAELIGNYLSGLDVERAKEFRDYAKVIEESPNADFDYILKNKEGFNSYMPVGLVSALACLDAYGRILNARDRKAKQPVSYVEIRAIPKEETIEVKA
jgi:hypothetical protein